MSADDDAKKPGRIRRRLLGWFARYKRDLPWRRTRDPYAVWLSEMMLQQTQVATVAPYYRRFLSRFPTVHDLAAADLDDVLRLWAGLGYYARARNLHRAATVIVSRFDGRFPNTVAELRTLPGVGQYSAGAVASIAFDVRAPAVDGNVVRVVARLFNIAADVREGSGRKTVEHLAERLLPRSRCGDFNQAMMELGATVCLPGDAARCPSCPLRTECKARAAGTAADLPVQTRRPVVKLETHVVAAIRRNGRWLVVQRPAHGLWGGLWELPTAVLDGEPPAKLATRLVRDVAGSAFRIDPQPFCELRHQLTHRTIRFVGHVCKANSRHRTRPLAASRHGQTSLPVRPPHTKTKSRPKSETSPRSRWLPLSGLDALGMSRAMRKVVAALRESAGA